MNWPSVPSLTARAHTSLNPEQVAAVVADRCRRGSRPALERLGGGRVTSPWRVGAIGSPPGR